MERADELHAMFAELAEQMADDADTFAAYLEAAARRGDAERRLRIAAAEREIAGIQRRNAAKLRQARGVSIELEHLPKLPLGEVPGEDPASERDLPCPRGRERPESSG